MGSILDEYNKALQTGNRAYADYLRQIMGGIAGDPQAVASTGAQPNIPTTQGPAFLQGLKDKLNSLVSKDFPAAVAGDTPAETIAKNRANMEPLFGGVSFSRWGSVILGALLIASGLFGLAGGSSKHIIQLVQPTKP